MKGIVTYLLVYILVSLLPSHGNSLNALNSHNNGTQNQEHLIKKQQDLQIRLFEFVSENENEEDDFSYKKDLCSHLAKISGNDFCSFSFQLPYLELNYLNNTRTIPSAGIPIYQAIRNLRI